MTDNAQPIWPMPPDLTITWYASAEAVHRALWTDAAAEHGMTVDELLNTCEAGGIDSDGHDISFSHQEVMEGIKSMGCWGWVDTELNVIHAWKGEGVSPDMLIHFLAHEIGHITGTPDPDPFQEEMRAEQFGYVASLAMRLMKSHSEC